MYCNVRCPNTWMSVNTEMFGPNAVPFHYLEGLRLALYTPDESQKISVKKLTNPETFDALLHPNFGGLYDPALGPTDKDDLCGTCAQNYIYCPGHFGHVELPLPVYHPLFFKELLAILRSSCFRCGDLFFSRAVMHVFLSQMKVLDYGLITVAEELQQIAFGTLNCPDPLDNEQQSQPEYMCITAVDEYLRKELKNIDRKEARRESTAKNVTDFRHRLSKEFMYTHMVNKRRCCPGCQAPSRDVRSEYNSRVFLKGLSLRDANKWVNTQMANAHLAKHDSLSVTNDANENRDERENTNNSVEDAAKGSDADIKKLLAQTYLTPLEVRKQIFQIWEKHGGFLSILYGAYPSPTAKQRCCSADMFFIEILPVAPSRFRPLSKVGGKQFENPQTRNLKKIMEDCVLVRSCLQDLNKPLPDDQDAQIEKRKKSFGKNAPVTVPGKTATERLHNAWLKLQTDVNCYIDSDLDRVSVLKFPGIRQILEKKEGLFRKHMMGKRVDYACRSVISPDPFLNVDEIGIPEVFALKLTYPQPVTHWNVKQLRQAVINGPLQHPGATFVENEDGKVTLLSKTDPNQRQAIAKRLLTPSTDIRTLVSPCKKVYRHLQNGDVLLLNRQPSLHRPSMMAHKARVLPGEKTIRLHYANCKSYNADFDGDEMNAHFPQNELARAEAYHIASTNFQYLVPKDGTPLNGLIQDHMVAGVRMTIRGRMFKRSDYQQLVYSAVSFKNRKIKMLRPCIVKPCELWSGKQVISTVLLNLIPEEAKLLSMQGKAKIVGKNWITGKPKEHFLGLFSLKGDMMSEAEVVVRQGHLLSGVLDKAHYGPTSFGLVHCCHELYGGVVAGYLLTALARVFTTFLQYQGFTLGVEDILVKEKADNKRHKFIKKGRASGVEATKEALGLFGDCESSTLEQKLQEAHHNKDGSDMKQLDLSMKKKTDHYQDMINRACIPLGLLKRFPENNLQLMVQSGAKGSSVNCMQISCLLGQIELEGRRPPLMVSGRSLPSFLPYDSSPRAGGFVDGRFLTGIRPQEYFFHCMAGREGLVDTAVKTSRSGYLQRCLIKHLEGLLVNYDLTVRDSDSSLVQFYYGEDGLDVMKTSFLSEKQFPFMASNYKAFLQQMNPKALLPHLQSEEALKLENKINKKMRKQKESHIKRTSPYHYFAADKCKEIQNRKSSASQLTFGRSETDLKMIERWNEAPLAVRKRYHKESARFPDPVLSKLQPDRHFGAVSERIFMSVKNYMEGNPDKCLTEYESEESLKLPSSKFKNLIYLKAFRALAEPGEAVGLLAAQSIGEPSTQMTLNTFHFAGRGEMNVTLGIPRLREILMTASANIKTPTMDLPLKPRKRSQKLAKQLQRQLTKVTLAQVLQSVDVWESLPSKTSTGTRERWYRIRFQFLSELSFKDELIVRSEDVLHHMETVFIKRVIGAVIKAAKVKRGERTIESVNNTEQQRNDRDEERSTQPDDDDDDDNADLSDEEAADGDANEAKQRQRRQQHASYEAPDEDEQMVERELDDSSEDGDSSEATISSRMDATIQDDEDLKYNESKGKRKSRKTDDARIQRVLESDIRIGGYSYDVKKEEWCEVSLMFPADSFKIQLSSLIEKLAYKSVVYETPHINRCFLIENNDTVVLKTEGVNIQETWQYEDVLDLTKVYTNDIHAMARVYGIEAAAKVIKKEIKNVFNAYGINVDPRHLSLISDYMTYEGTIKPFNRLGLESNASPFQKMSFETTTHFLRGAVLSGDTERLVSPSSRLVVGRVVESGTGCFELLQPLC